MPGTDIVNIVTADDGPDGAPADTDDATVDVVQSKALNIEKNASVTGDTANATSDVITYSYTLTNTGNAAISGIVLTDDNGTPGDTSDDFSPSFVGGDTDGDSALDVGETWTYSRTKNVTQAMLDAGTDIVNIVTADGPGTAPDDRRRDRRRRAEQGSERREERVGDRRHGQLDLGRDHVQLYADEHRQRSDQRHRPDRRQRHAGRHQRRLLAELHRWRHRWRLGARRRRDLDLLADQERHASYARCGYRYRQHRHGRRSRYRPRDRRCDGGRRAEQGAQRREERQRDRRSGGLDVRCHHLQLHADQHRQRSDQRYRADRRQRHAGRHQRRLLAELRRRRHGQRLGSGRGRDLDLLPDQERHASDARCGH